jgi:hypothetical protein
MVWRGVRLIAGLPMGRPIPLRVTVPTPSPPRRVISPVVERHAGKNQHPVGGVNIVAAVFTDGGNRLQSFNVATRR